MFKSVFRTGIRAAYNVLDNPSFVSEPWSIYPAKHKSSGKHASVFIFDKTKFESQIYKLCQVGSNSKNPKLIISECYELIKFEVNQLTKLKHPQLLTVLEVLEETKTKFIFATEAVNNNLITVNMGNLDNLTIQKGLLQVSKGLQFLHNLCSIVHFNLQPSSVFIDTQGDWKLAGFMFLQNLNEVSPQERDNFYIMSNSSIVPFANLNLNYTAPELLVDSHLKLDYANDIWSLGCLIFYLYNDGDTLLHCFDSSNVGDYKSEFKKFEGKFYNHRPSDLKYLLKNVPSELYTVYPQLMARYPTDRITIDQFIDSSFFNGSLIKAMLFIDEFTTKTLDEKRIFMKGLLESENTPDDILSQLPTHFKSLKVVPLLVEVIHKEIKVIQDKNIDKDIEELICSSLSVAFKIGAGLSSLTFQDKIYTTLLKEESNRKKSVSIAKKLINLSVAVRLEIVKNLSILKSKLTKAQFSTLLKDLIGISLGQPIDKNDLEINVILQEQILKELPSIIDIYEFPYIKGDLFPAICLVFKSTTVLTTKLLTIETFEILVERNIIDKLIVTEQLFPVLQNLKSRDKRIISLILKLFLSLTKNDQHIALDLEVSVQLVLSQAMDLTFGCDNCNAAEFRSFMLIIESIQKILVKKKLDTLPQSTDTSTSDGLADKFGSLINNQKVTATNKDDIFKAPKSKEIMQPKKKLTPLATNSAQERRLDVNSSMNLALQKSNDIVIPKSKSIINNDLKDNSFSRGSRIQPLSLKDNTGSTKQKLSLVGNSINTPNNNRLLQTLNKSPFPQASQNDIDDDDDDFEDFQVASIPLRKPKPSNGSPASSSTIMPASPSSANVQNYPPGFNLNMVLTPTSAKSRNDMSKLTSNLLDLL